MTDLLDAELDQILTVAVLPFRVILTTLLLENNDLAATRLADDRGRDVFARLLYGFRVSIFFGLILACLGTVLGILIGAMQGNQDAMDGFVSVMAGTLPAPEFFAPENVGGIMAQAAALA